MRGRRLIHLQCHFGLDTLSWAREGAHVVGIDFSEAAIRSARSLAEQAGLTARFDCVDVYGIGDDLNGAFDIVYTGLGALCWLPDIARWARTVARLLDTGGDLYLHEFHPFEWIFDDQEPKWKYDYFTPAEGLRIDLPGSYADPAAVTQHDATVQWNHGLGAVVSALVDAGLVIKRLEEHSFSAAKRWPFMTEGPDGDYHLPADKPNLPLLYTLRTTKPSA